jgi:hypothetical protein
MSQANGSVAMKARGEAVKRLVAAHQEEYNELLIEERVKLGLPGDQAAAIREKKIQKHLAELTKLGYEGPVPTQVA